MMRLQIGLSNDKNIYIYTMWSLFDLLASIGGFIVCLATLTRIWLFVFTFNEIEDFLVSKLFKNSLSERRIARLKGKDEEEQDKKVGFNTYHKKRSTKETKPKKEKFKISLNHLEQSNFKSFLHWLLKEEYHFLCLKKSSRDRIFEKGRKHLDAELNIISII